MTTASEDKDPNLGRVVGGKYQIDTMIGFGSVGTVYRATHTQLKKTVAIKTLRTSLASDPTTVARFTREAQLASQLDHTHIVKVFDYGTEPDGLTYMVMELLEGPELHDVINREAPMPAARAVALLGSVLSALAEAHRHGIVHRDLKPENVMLVQRTGEDGKTIEVVKVTDFGIAKAYGEAAQASHAITTFGTVNGTPEYMSPEQAHAEELDGRSDLYACGVILFRMLTGDVPYDGDSPLQILEKHVRDPIPVPSQRHRGADPRLDPVVTKALAKNRDDRYADATTMRAAMIAALEQPAAAPVVESLSSSVLIESGASVLIEPDEVAKANAARSEPVPTGSVLIESGASVLLDEGALERAMPSAEPEPAPAAKTPPKASVADAEPAVPAKRASDGKAKPKSTEPEDDDGGPGLIALLVFLAVAAAGGAWWLLRSQDTSTPPSEQNAPAVDARPINPNLPQPTNPTLRPGSQRPFLPHVRPRLPRLNPPPSETH